MVYNYRFIFSLTCGGDEEMSVKYEEALENYLLRGYSPEQAAELARQMTKATGGTVPSNYKQKAQAKSIELKAEYPQLKKVTQPALPGGPVKVMSKADYDKMIQEYSKNLSACPLGNWPVHFEAPDGNVYFFRSIDELVAFQKRTWPEIYDPNSVQFKARLMKEKAYIELENKFNEIYGDFTYYGDIGDKLRQALDEAKKVLDETNDLSKASQVLSEKAQGIIQSFIQQHPGAGIAYALNKNQVTVEEVKKLDQALAQAKQAQTVGVSIPPAQVPWGLAALGIGILIIGVVLWRKG
jgi:hypothetical protein